jgi:hypothetical protein
VSPRTFWLQTSCVSASQGGGGGLRREFAQERRHNFDIGVCARGAGHVKAGDGVAVAAQDGFNCPLKMCDDVALRRHVGGGEGEMGAPEGFEEELQVVGAERGRRLEEDVVDGGVNEGVANGGVEGGGG